MASQLQIQVQPDKITEFCRCNSIRRLVFIGSVLRHDFRPESDVDVLVGFEKDVHCSLLDLARIQMEIEAILGRKVDLIEQSALEKSRNYIRRKAILESAETFYAA